jgi:hypothetical protein
MVLVVEPTKHKAPVQNPSLKKKKKTQEIMAVTFINSEHL